MRNPSFPSGWLPPYRRFMAERGRMEPHQKDRRPLGVPCERISDVRVLVVEDAVVEAGIDQVRVRLD